ncbi:MAG: DUF1801 domain-containing protein [Candidatus Saccharimonas sp.]|nr:DUF1801 domain-containing protein [Planctomycetaceae bacterium]
MQSKATTVEQYLSELPEERRAAIATVRHVILKNLDKDYEEGMQYGMISFYVPHRIYPAGYHTDPKQPLPFACLASQSDYMSLYMMTVYGEGAEETWFRDEWAKTGKKLDMGKSCIRFKKIEDLALNVVGEAIRRVPARKFIEHYESVLKNSRKSSSKPAKKKAAKAKSTPAAQTAKTSKPVTAKKPAKKATKKAAVKKAAKKIVKKAAKVVKKAVKKKATRK